MPKKIATPVPPTGEVARQAKAKTGRELSRWEASLRDAGGALFADWPTIDAGQLATDLPITIGPAALVLFARLYARLTAEQRYVATHAIVGTATPRQLAALGRMAELKAAA